MTVPDQRPLMAELLPDSNDRLVGVLATTYNWDVSEFLGQDWLPHVLGLPSWRELGARGKAYLEQKLAQVPVTLVVDVRGALLSQEGRPPLRVNLLPYSGATWHAKVTVLVRERSVVIVIGSANLTTAAYRENREVAGVLRYGVSDGELAPADGIEFLEALRQLVEDTPSSAARDAVERHLAEAVRVLRTLPDPVRTAHRLGPHLLLGGPGRPPLLEQVLELWRPGRRVHAITICSPFWSEEGRLFATLRDGLTRVNALGRNCRLHLICQGNVNDPENATPVFPATATRALRQWEGLAADAVAADPTNEVKDGGYRRLHAKILVLEGSDETLVVAGSANFTEAGYGLLPNPNVEAVVGYILKGDSAQRVKALLPRECRNAVDLIACRPSELTPPEPQEEARPWPWFLGPVDLCKVSSATSREEEYLLRFPIVRRDRRTKWRAHTMGGQLILDWVPATAEQTATIGPERYVDLISDGMVRIRWNEGGGELEAAVPIQVDADVQDELPVSQDGKLTELDLIYLYSSRLSEEQLAERLAGDEQGEKDDDLPVELVNLDPARHSVYRVRTCIQALPGLRHRLEDVPPFRGYIRWALVGDFSPSRLADMWMDRWRTGERSAISTIFLLTETAREVDAAQPNWFGEDEDATVLYSKLRRDLLRRLRDCVQQVMADPALKGMARSVRAYLKRFLPSVRRGVAQ